MLEEGKALHGSNEEFQARLRTARSNVSEQHYIEGLGRAEEAAKAQRSLLRCAQLSDLTACDEALKGRPNDPQILAAKGDALMKAGRPAEAAVAYRRAAELDPANRALTARISTAEEQRARLVSECSTGKGAAAVQACDAALIRGAPDEFSIQQRKGMQLQSMGESSRALDAYIAADTVKSGDRSVALAIVSLTEDGKQLDAIALAARGSALLTLGRGSEAAIALRQARALAPGLARPEPETRCGGAPCTERAAADGGASGRGCRNRPRTGRKAAGAPLFQRRASDPVALKVSSRRAAWPAVSTSPHRRRRASRCPVASARRRP